MTSVTRISIVGSSQPLPFSLPKPQPKYPGDDLFLQAVQAHDYRTVDYWFETLISVEPLVSMIKTLSSRLLVSEEGDKDRELLVSLLYRGLLRYDELCLTSQQIEICQKKAVGQAIMEIFTSYSRITGPVTIAHFIQLLEKKGGRQLAAISGACQGGHSQLLDALLFRFGKFHHGQNVVYVWLALAIRGGHENLYDRLTQVAVPFGIPKTVDQVRWFLGKEGHLVESYYRWMARPVERDEIGRLLFPGSQK